MQFLWLMRLAVRAGVCRLFSLSAGFVQLVVSFTTNCSGQGWFWGCCMRQDGSHHKWGKNQNNHVLGEEIQKWQNAISDVCADRMSDTASILILCNPTLTNLFYQTRWISWGKPEPYLKKIHMWKSASGCFSSWWILSLCSAKTDDRFCKNQLGCSQTGSM